MREAFTVRNVSVTSQEKKMIEKLGIPVDSSHPSKWWIVSLDEDSLMPTDAELAQLRSYLEFKVRSFYREGYADKILAHPLPYDPGHNTQVFRKGHMWPEHGAGWCYRRSTWQRGPMFVPIFDARDHSLIEVMARAEDLVPQKWLDWMAARPETFPPEEGTGYPKEEN